jgi:serine/threonine protein kinase
MKNDGWEKAKMIFADAIKLAPELRLRFLDEACADDTETRREVESLLASFDDADSFMETPAVNEVADVVKSNDKQLKAGKRFGHYEIIKQIGAGGMGEVYLAKDTRLNRQVALKLLSMEVDSDKAKISRFKQEARAASALNHPNILTVFDIGETDSAHFIATEFVNGKTLRE